MSTLSTSIEITMTVLEHRPGNWRNLLLALTALLSLGAARAEPIDDMIAFDAVYIPALALSTGAAQDANKAAKARVALAALRAQWPALQRRLGASWGTRAPAGWSGVLSRTGQHIDQAVQASARSDWHLAHEALEPVRIDMMKARQRHGMDYFIDRLTAFHEPMELLATAASTTPPAALDARRRAELERAYLQARVLWRGIEMQPVDETRYGLSATRRAQLHTAVDDETRALGQLSDAFRANDNLRLLKAAAAIKPPFSRAFTAFGRAEGDGVH